MLVEEERGAGGSVLNTAVEDHTSHTKMDETTNGKRG